MQICLLKMFLLFMVKVCIPEFLNGIGNEVETYAEKLEAEFGDLHNLLVARSMKLKKLNVGADPKLCKHVSEYVIMLSVS
ncbi:putative IGR protein [Helianthus anomalus]